METREEGKAEKTFKNFGQKIDGFIDEFHEAAENLEKEFSAKYEDLKVAAENLKKEAGNNERWQEIESGLKKAGDEVANAFRSAFKK
ncbi:MAG TPA: hypothetical protein VD884_12050 [Ohtaekwangia sp.]|nr:hypothetical protein [Ohtaekwangia sp.]